jgi:hypothetical protein
MFATQYVIGDPVFVAKSCSRLILKQKGRSLCGGESVVITSLNNEYDFHNRSSPTLTNVRFGHFVPYNFVQMEVELPWTWRNNRRRMCAVPWGDTLKYRSHIAILVKASSHAFSTNG